MNAYDEGFNHGFMQVPNINTYMPKSKNWYAYEEGYRVGKIQLPLFDEYPLAERKKLKK